MRELGKIDDKKPVVNENIVEDTESCSSGDVELLEDNCDVRTEIANIV